MLRRILVEHHELGAGALVVEQCAAASGRERLGVALDVGSIVDYWMGLKTRSFQDLA